MQSIKEFRLKKTIEHECPFKAEIVAKKFKCDNLKIRFDHLKSENAFYCIVGKCPRNFIQYEEEEIIVKY